MSYFKYGVQDKNKPRSIFGSTQGGGSAGYSSQRTTPFTPGYSGGGAAHNESLFPRSGDRSSSAGGYAAPSTSTNYYSSSTNLPRRSNNSSLGSYQKPHSYSARNAVMDPWKVGPKDYPLPGKPTDLRRIFTMQWSPTDDLLFIPFQDGNLKGWACRQRYGSNDLQVEAILNVNLQFPITAMDFIDDGTSFLYTDFQGKLMVLDLEDLVTSYMGCHQIGISRVHYYPKHSLAMSLGQDSRIKLFDARQPDPVFDQPMGGGAIPVTSELKGDLLVMGCNDNKIYMLNVEMLMHDPAASMYAEFECPLYHKVEHIAINSNCSTIAISGAESRIAIRELNLRKPFNIAEMMKPSMSVRKNYNFKCHREDSKDLRKSYIRPLNGMKFHPRRNDILATCGGDGIVFVWDIDNQSSVLRCKPLPNPRTPIPHIAYNKDGNLLAYIVGDDGSHGLHPDEKWGFGYFVRLITEQDMKLRR